MAYKTASWGGCGRHLSPGMSSKVATDGPFEAVLGKTHRTGENPPYGILEGEGETRSSIEPAGHPFPTRQFIILARKDEPTPDYAPYLTSLAPLPVRRSFSILPMSGWLMPLARSSSKLRNTTCAKLCPLPS